MGMSRESFHWADYVIMGCFLVTSLVIGIVQACIGGKQKTQSEYLLADRGMRILPVSMSILVSYLSAILIIGTPAEVYTGGTQYWLYAVGGSLGCMGSAMIFVPLLYPLKLTSSYEVGDFMTGQSVYLFQTYFLRPPNGTMKMWSYNTGRLKIKVQLYTKLNFGAKFNMFK